MVEQDKKIKPIKDEEEKVAKGEVKVNKIAFETDKEFEQQIIDLARVTRVTSGGKRMRFRACVAIGDHNGRIAMGVAKGADVTIAVNKAKTQAKKHLITVTMRKNTIPHEVHEKFGAARIILKPAPLGTGIIAGGAVRIILELAGVKDVVGKILGSKSKINNVKATINALSRLKKISNQ
jgi:small subunit ribosomal protein S5